jgi:hypothetical protein
LELEIKLVRCRQCGGLVEEGKECRVCAGVTALVPPSRRPWYLRHWWALALLVVIFAGSILFLVLNRQGEQDYEATFKDVTLSMAKSSFDLVPMMASTHALMEPAELLRARALAQNLAQQNLRARKLNPPLLFVDAHARLLEAVRLYDLASQQTMVFLPSTEAGQSINVDDRSARDAFTNLVLADKARMAAQTSLYLAKKRVTAATITTK